MIYSWKIASSYITGRGHIENNIPCQDRVDKLVKDHKPSGTFYGLALADGAGSCSHSHIGAEFITTEVLEFLNSNFSNMFKYENKHKNSSLEQYLTRKIENKIDKLANQLNVDDKELSSTLLFIAIKEDKKKEDKKENKKHYRYIIGHIGDGVIGILENENQLRVISQPENGEFANSTFFTTSKNHKNRLRIIKGYLEDNTTGFVLMSDGTGASLYDKRQNKLSMGVAKMINWLKIHSEEEVEEALYNNLEIISKYTTDDCSIGIMRCNK